MRRSNFYKTIFISLSVIVLFLLDIFLGSVRIPFREVMNTLTGRSVSETYQLIIFQSRIPKALTAILAGIALPVGGLIMQTFFRNPLAGPDVLGISSGSGLMVAIVLMGAGSFGIETGLLNDLGIIAASVFGGGIILLIILSISNKVKDVVSLLLLGLMLGTAISALVSILQYFSEREALKNYMLWTFGNLSGVSWQQLGILIPVILLTLLTTYFSAKYLNGLLLGDAYAQSMGISLKKTRYFLVMIAAIFTGSITAFCGPVTFIGIAVPHLARMIYKTTDHFILIPACALTGAGIMLLCDIISQMPGYDLVLPINSITALMGGPFIFYIIFRNQRLNKYYF